MRYRFRRLVCKILGHRSVEGDATYWVRFPDAVNNEPRMMIADPPPLICTRCHRYAKPVTLLTSPDDKAHISNVAVFGRRLSVSEVRNLYDAGMGS